MLARLFIVFLLALSLGSMRGSATFEVPCAAEVFDTDAAPEGSEAMVTQAYAACDPVPTQVAVARPVAEGMRSSPDLGRVFRPPRLLGSSVV